MNSALRQIITDCFKDFNAFSDPIKVTPAVPILWFGNMESYWNSKKRIVSVALNPSEIEFATGTAGVFSLSTRFPGLNGNVNPSPEDYYKAMNEYFLHDPYMAWFQGPERVLNALSANYKPGKDNTAVHIDVYAPVATSPHWNGLTQNQRNLLISSFSKYYDQMIEFLDPDIILASFDSKVIAGKFTDSVGNPCSLLNAKGCWKPANKKTPFLRLYKLPGQKRLITGGNISGSAFAGLTAKECVEGIDYLNAIEITRTAKRRDD